MEVVRLSQLHGAFLSDLLAHRKAKKTRDTYESHFTLFLRFLSNDDLRALQTATLHEYVSFLATWKGPRTRGAGLATNSIHSHIASLKSFCRWLVKRKFVKEDPAADLENVTRPAKLPRAIPSQWAQILPAMTTTARNRALLMLMRTCALRRSELVNLDLADVDLANGVLVVRSGKGGKDRGLPLDTATRDALQAWLSERGRTDGPLFVGCRGERLGQYGVGQVLSRAAQRAKLPHITPHQLRHTWATEAVNDGVPVTVVQEALGHESLTTTQQYTHVTASQLKETFRRLEEMRARKE